MKKAILSIVLVAGVSANAAKLVNSESYKNSKTGEVKVSLSAGFGETGFLKPDAVCFVGSINEVCGEVASEAAMTQRGYREGDHGMFKMDACSIVKKEYETVVKVDYTRVNDYEDDQKISVEITDCN